MSHHKDRSHATNIKPAKDDEDKHGEVSMESDVESDSPAKTEDETQGTDNPENDEPEEENASKSTRYNTQDPLNEIRNIKIEPTVEKEDSDDIPDLELFEPSVKNKREESEVDEDDDE